MSNQKVREFFKKEVAALRRIKLRDVVKTGQFVDAKDSDKKWRVSKVVTVD